MPNFTKYEKILALLFLLTIPLVRPWIHGDGRGYYAFARAALFQRDLDFRQDFARGAENDPRASDPSFRARFVTPTGHIWNHFTIGPAILWSPFLLAARAVTPVLDKMRGTHDAADGFSRPYLVAMALGTFVYGFLTLWISFEVARKYLPERWAFLSTIGIWLATSFAFYVYVQPSFSHTHSAFLCAAFVWLWDRTRRQRSAWQWVALGALAGLLADTYYPNVFVLLLLVIESLALASAALGERNYEQLRKIVVGNLLFLATAALIFSPTLFVKKALWGSYLRSGYREHWYWNSPHFFAVCFSSHGLLSWTPILVPAVVGLVFFKSVDRKLAYSMLATLLAFVYFIGCYEGWHAMPSFGNRFFISFTVFFVIGLAALLSEAERRWKSERLFPLAAAVVTLLICWNSGLIYQFAAHLFPQDSDVSWRQVARNQLTVVPEQLLALVRKSMPGHSEVKADNPEKDD
jgi:MFS family permease